MSRCFPYPPPFLEESLIESIKAKKEEREMAKEVERRRVKKENKKGKKREEKRENVEQKSANSQQHEGKSNHEEKSLSEQKDLYSQRTSNDAIEQLEGSGLTEEHELPSFTGDKYDSPESSQDSNKRRKLVSSICGHNKHGNVLRIKLPLRSTSSSRVDLEPLQPSLRPPAMQTAGQVVVAKSKEMVHELPEVHEQPSVSGKDEIAAVPSHLSSDVKRIRRRTGQRVQFEDLIVSWTPPLSQLESLDVSSEWWHFGDPKRRSTPCTNECEAITVGGSSCGERRISLQQPRACYLPEFDAYQLPYVVPF